MSRPVDPRLTAEVPETTSLLAALSVFQIAGGILSVAQAVLLADLIGSRFDAHPPRIGDRLAALLLVGCLRACTGAWQEWTAARGALRIQATLRSRALSAVVRLGPVWSGQQPAGRLVTATGSGLEVLEGYVTRALPALVSACVVPPLVLVAIGFDDWESAAVLVVVLPLVPIFMVLVGITTRRRMTEQYSALSEMAGHFLDLVQGITTLKIYGQAHQQRLTVERDAEKYRLKTMGMLRMAFMSGLVLDLIATLGIAVVAVDVGLRLDGGHLSLTRALVVLLLAPELFAPLRAFGAQFHANEAGQAAICEALDIVSEATLLAPVGEKQASRLTGGLRLDGLTVTYPGREEPALDGVSLEVVAGEVIGLQGVSGAGKSTVLAGILGLLPTGDALSCPAPGGWAPVESITPMQWRAGVAWVPQRPSPTQPTVSREVLLGDPSATAEEVASVLRLCQTPSAETVLGEDGRGISAGERRRVALARAVLRARAVIATGQRPIVLLDEPSEDLDRGTQQVVLGVIAGLAGLATVIVATHSETVLATADRRVVMAAGRILSVSGQIPNRRFSLPSSGAVEEPVPVPERHRNRLRLLEKVTRQLLVPSLISGAAGLAGLGLTTTSLWLICRAAERPNVQALALAVVGVRTFALSRALLRYAERLAGHDTALRMLRDVRAQVFAALVPLAPGGLDGFRRGDLLRRFLTDVDAVQEGLVRAAIPTAGAVLSALGASVFAAILDPWAGVVLATGMVVAVAAVPLIAKAAAGPGELAAELAAQRDTRVSGMLDGLAELTAYGAEAAALGEISSLDLRAARAARRFQAATVTGAVVAGVTAAVTLVGVLTVGVNAHGLSPVSLGVLLGCVIAGFDAVAPLPSAYAAWGRFSAAQDRVLEVIEQQPVMPAGHRPAPATELLGLTVDRLELAAMPGGRLLLNRAELEVGAGTAVAVMGPSGCGKSTLLAAAMRLRPVAGGSFAVTSGPESVPLVDIVESDVPPVVAGSLQGDHVFNVSLRDNLRVIKPDATEAELNAAATSAGLFGFIHGLPLNWSTMSGPEGAALSGGQRQRLLLARALLAHPAVLILDEPTAHLDAETEREVLSSLLAHGDQTLLISTHRELPSGLFDRVVHIADGTLDTVDCVAAG